MGIATPSNGATIIGPDVNVSGIVINSSGTETGVTVNGVIAAVTGTTFIANHVPLQLGSNSITVAATDVNGATATATRTVTTQAGNYIRLTTNIESGTAPLEITLRIDGSFPVDEWTYGYPNTPAVVPQELANPDELGFRITEEGTYIFTASAVGPDGLTYSDTLTVTVTSRVQMDNLLKGKWAGMKGAMTLMDVQTAMGFFTAESKDRYSGIFTALGNTLPQVAQDMQNIKMIYLKDRIAKYRIKRTEITGETTYYIYFVKDDSGLWKIQQF